jgi:WD40 repeat protein
VNFDGPVRAADTAGAGTALVKLSFDAWPDGRVAPTLHSIPVQAARPGPKPEPVAPNLVATLIHPDRKATIGQLEFSPDGAKLFASGYPSGIVQMWDVSSQKEVRRIDTPPGLRSSLRYAVLTPDWKTLYVAASNRKIGSVEKDGKAVPRVDYTGSVRVWDLGSGEERTSLRPPAGVGPEYAALAPDGASLVCAERGGFHAGEDRPAETVIIDLKTGARRKLGDGFIYPSFSPDGKAVAITQHDFEAKRHVLKVLEFATGKELASLTNPDKESYLFAGEFSPDGSVLTATVSVVQKGPRPALLFLDAKTLAERGRFTGEAGPDGRGSIGGKFTPDGKSYVIIDPTGKAHVWDVAAAKVVRSFEVGNQSWNVAITPDGKTLAVGWMPKSDRDGERVRDPDPRDYPQPRVTLFDLSGVAAPRVLVAPHGFVGSLALSPDGKTLAFGGAGAVHLFDLSK